MRGRRRLCGRVAKINWFFKNLGFVKSQNYKHAKSSGFSENISRHIALQPHLNIGIFSLEGNSSAWGVWQKNLEKALMKGNVFGSEQVAMNVSVYSDNIPVDILPFYCNWIPYPASQNTLSLRFSQVGESFTSLFRLTTMPQNGFFNGLCTSVVQ